MNTAYSVVVTDDFGLDLLDAISYLTDNLRSPGAAKQLVDSVDAAVDLFSEQPFLHALSSRDGWSDSGYREHLLKHYVIVYRIQEQAVLFLRLLHQTQLLERHVIEW